MNKLNIALFEEIHCPICLEKLYQVKFDKLICKCSSLSLLTSEVCQFFISLDTTNIFFSFGKDFSSHSNYKIVINMYNLNSNWFKFLQSEYGANYFSVDSQNDLVERLQSILTMAYNIERNQIFK